MTVLSVVLQASLLLAALAAVLLAYSEVRRRRNDVRLDAEWERMCEAFENVRGTG